MPHNLPSDIFDFYRRMAGCVLLEIFWPDLANNVTMGQKPVSKTAPPHESSESDDDGDRFPVKTPGTIPLRMPRQFSNRPNPRIVNSTTEMRKMKPGCHSTIDSFKEAIVNSTFNRIQFKIINCSINTKQQQ